MSRRTTRRRRERLKRFVTPAQIVVPQSLDEDVDARIDDDWACIPVRSEEPPTDFETYWKQEFLRFGGNPLPRIKETASQIYAAGFRALPGLTITESVQFDLVELARGSLGEEICGVIAGHDTFAMGVYPILNSADESPDDMFGAGHGMKAVHYFMDPVDQIRAYTEIEQDGLEIVAYYHSHPGGEAMPSSIDRRLAVNPGAIWVLISSEEPVPVRAWRIEKALRDEEDRMLMHGTLIEVPLRIEPA